MFHWKPYARKPPTSPFRRSERDNGPRGGACRRPTRGEGSPPSAETAYRAAAVAGTCAGVTCIPLAATLAPQFRRRSRRTPDAPSETRDPVGKESVALRAPSRRRRAIVVSPRWTRRPRDAVLRPSCAGVECAAESSLARGREGRLATRKRK